MAVFACVQLAVACLAPAGAHAASPDVSSTPAPASASPVLAASENRRTIEGCILAAARAHRLPPAMLVILLNVEGGSLGRVSQNTNDTVDIGPMQINQIWIPQLAAHWHATATSTFSALRDNFCANVEAGGWILRLGLDEAGGDFWLGVGFYHSHDPDQKARYLRAVLRQVVRLQAQSPAAAALVRPQNGPGRLEQAQAGLTGSNLPSSRN